MILQNPLTLYRPGWPRIPSGEIAIVTSDQVGECYDIQVLDERYQNFILDKLRQLLKKA